MAINKRNKSEPRVRSMRAAFSKHESHPRYEWARRPIPAKNCPSTAAEIIGILMAGIQYSAGTAYRQRISIHLRDSTPRAQDSIHHFLRQSALSAWHQRVPEETLADAIFHRIVRDSYTIEIGSSGDMPSIRQKHGSRKHIKRLALAHQKGGSVYSGRVTLILPG